MMAAFPLLLLVLVVAAPSPLLRSDADSDMDNGSPGEDPSSAHSPAPSSALRSADKEGDYNKKKAMEVKAGSGSAEEQPADVAKRREEMFHFSSSHHYKVTNSGSPEELIGEVLRRLPGRSLAMPRRLCRAWRAVVDRLRLLLPHMLPHSVAGIISNYRDFSRFFARPSCTRIDAAFDFVQRGKDGLASMIVDHCNGLLLYDDGWHWTHLYVCNPATRRWALLPAVPGLDLYPGLCFAGAYLAFDPAVSLHYEVFLIPDVPEKTTGYDEEDAEDLMEWPPPCDQLMVFSSRTRRWEERAFVRVGVAAGTVAEVRSYMVVDHNWKTGYSYAEYWRGALYVHCCAGPFVSRFCTSECNYQVIKAPTNMEENENMRSNFGRSEKGMYYASFRGHRLRVWILFEESHGLPEWVLKYDVNLNLLSYRMNTLYSEEINRPWAIDDDDSEKQENNRQSDEWNSDNDDVLEYDECSHEQQRHGGFRFLGFHPYKEVVFLSHSNNDVLVPCIRNAVACHLASLKVQYLGRNNPKDFGHWQSQEGSFIYTPCLLDLLPQRE